MAVVDHTIHRPADARLLPPVELDEAAARCTLRGQIAKLESELAAAFVSSFPRKGVSFGVAGRGGPRMLSLGELEALRDDLSDRLSGCRRELEARAIVEDANRLLVEDMLRDPARHKWVRVSREDVGGLGCGHWHVRPRLGLLGMLMGWWRVRISSGCPLATAGPERTRALGSADLGTT